MTGEDELLHGAISTVLARGTHDAALAEHQADLREYPLSIVPALQPCRRIIYTTKLDWLRHLMEDARIPADVALLWRYCPLGEPHRALVRAVVQRLGAPMYFIGDLDPLDLVTFATLAEPGESPLATARYLGVSDAWLERCKRDLASQPGKSFQTACIRMEADERDGFERLKQIPLDWASFVGNRSWALLESGLKLELEGASNPKRYSSSFRDELLRSIFED